MKNQKLVNALMELGLDYDSVKSYEYLISEPKINVSKMCKYLDINRMKGYAILTNLESHGLVSNDDKQGIVINPVSPTKVVELLREKELKNKLLANSLADEMPSILNRFLNLDGNAKVKNYQGKSGFIKAANQILDETPNGSVIYSLYETQSIYDYLGLDFALDWIDRRKSKNIKVKIIAGLDTKFTKSKHVRETTYQGKIKRVKLKKDFNGYLMLNSVSIYFWNLKTMEVVVIYDATMTEFFETLFNNYWDLLI